MTTTIPNNHVPQFTGKHMILVMVCFFGVIIIVNFTMAYLASNTWTGLVVKNTYVASQHYNETLEAAEKQNALGLGSKISYHKNQLVFSIYDRDGKQVSIANPTLKIGRPAFEQADQVMSFLPGKSFSNHIPIHLKPGVWALTITGEVSGEPYRRDARMFVNSDNVGAIE
ncbi:MAG: FixH family protein [Rhizobiaceae bacterium]|nr:FixH family protein [Rhizobiaceae bacterium]